MNATINFTTVEKSIRYDRASREYLCTLTDRDGTALFVGYAANYSAGETLLSNEYTRMLDDVQAGALCTEYDLTAEEAEACDALRVERVEADGREYATLFATGAGDTAIEVCIPDARRYGAAEMYIGAAGVNVRLDVLETLLPTITALLGDARVQAARRAMR